MNEKLKKVKELLYSAKHAVFFGGAGVSTASGIPDFRGAYGLYSKNGAGNEYFLSHRCLMKEPELFYEFFTTNMVYPEAKPNPAHFALSKLEREGVIKSVVTQNIDGLHQAAGSKKVIELHGSAETFYCARCGKLHEKEYVISSKTVPLCRDCGGIVRPDVVLYGEALDDGAFKEAENDVKKADLLIVGGTSLRVFPAASLVAECNCEHLVIINRDATPYDEYAEYIFREPIAEVMSVLAELTETEG